MSMVLAIYASLAIGACIGIVAVSMCRTASNDY